MTIYASIDSTGSYLPKNAVSNYDLESKIDTNHEWIYTRSGISSRHIADEFETTSYMAGEAAKDAFLTASISVDDIDLILVATCTPNHFFPSMASHVQHALGIRNPIPCFDISAACSGFIYALDVANQYIKSGAAKNVLIVGSEAMSRAVSWEDRGTCVLFGDGAGAAVITASARPGVIASKLYSNYDHENFLTYPHTFDAQKTMICMKGSDVFKIAVKAMGDIVDDILTIAQLAQSDIDWLVPHQANIRIIQAIAKKLHLPMSQVITTIENQGNTSAASIPLALDYAIKSQRIKREDVLLLEAFGAGLTWGATVLTY